MESNQNYAAALDFMTHICNSLKMIDPNTGISCKHISELSFIEMNFDDVSFTLTPALSLNGYIFYVVRQMEVLEFTRFKTLLDVESYVYSFIANMDIQEDTSLCET